MEFKISNTSSSVSQTIQWSNILLMLFFGISAIATTASDGAPTISNITMAGGVAHSQ